MSDIFISYSRKDQAFVKQLFAALEEQNREAWVDWQGIPPTAEWLAEVYAAIDAADAFIFVISPDSATSEICQLEVTHAIQQNKRLIPILLKEIDSAHLHEEIRKINWLRMCEENITTSLRSLIKALDTDLEWVKEHTRLTLRATEWNQHDLDDSQLLRGKDLENAEQWLAKAPDKSLDPTALQSRYITVSRQSSSKRQKRLMSGITTGLIIAIGLAIFAWIQRNTAIEESVRARSNALSSQAVLALDNDHDATLGFRYAAAAWKLNPSNTTAKSLLFRSQYGEGTFSYRGKRYRPPMYRDIKTNINFFQVNLSPDGERIAVISYPPDASESEINIIDLNGMTHGKVNGTFMMFSESGKYFATIEFKNMTGSVWDIKGNLVSKDKALFKMIQKLKGTFKMDKNKLVPIPHNPAILKTREKTLQKIKPWTFLEGDPGIELQVSYSRDQKLIAAYDNKRNYRVWNYKGNVVATFPKQSELITSADFSPDRQYLAVSHSNGDLEIWNLKSNKNNRLTAFDNKLVTLHGHTDTARSIKFMPNGNQLLSTARDGMIKIWDLMAFHVPSIVQSKKHAVDIYFYPALNRIITSAYPSAEILDYEGNKRQSTQGYFTKGLINSVTVSPDGKAVATVNGKKLHIRILDKDISLDHTAHNKNILSVTFSLSGKHIVTSDKELLKIWDLEGNLITTVNMKSEYGNVYNNTWKPYLIDTTDQYYFLVQTDKNIRLLNLEGNEIKNIPGKLGAGKMDKDMFSPKSKYVIITGGDHSLGVFDLTTMEIIAQTNELPKSNQNQIARFSPDKELIYAVNEFYGVIFIWDWNKDEIRKIDASYQLESAQVIPALDRVITKAIDNKIRFWDMNGTEIFYLDNVASGWVKLSPDGKHLAVHNRNDKGWPVELWNFDPESLIKQAERVGIPAIDYQ